mmetsp:Transcript_21365/g.61822  ORF Transcript_21365/g.61822 Transcript_21365/m.61822 type:complete len:291 (+) Transcript_21365:39-911(+)
MMPSTYPPPVLICICMFGFHVEAVRVLQDPIEKKADANASLVFDQDEVNLVFFAGLEGTGHHLMGKILHARTRSHSKCAVPLSLGSNTLFFSEGNITTVHELADLFDTEMGKYAAAGFRLAAISSWPRHSMMSYPDQSMHSASPNLVVMADVARQANVTLRVIVLERDADMMLRDGCIRKKYAPTCEADVERLVHHGRILLNDLQASEGINTFCVPYDEFNEAATSLAHFLVADEIEDIVQATFKPHDHEHDELLDQIKGPLEEHVAVVSDYCKSRSITINTLTRGLFAA